MQMVRPTLFHPEKFERERLFRKKRAEWQALRRAYGPQSMQRTSAVNMYTA